MSHGEADDEAAAVGVLAVERERAVHQHDDTATKEQSETKSLGEHIELGELLEDEALLAAQGNLTMSDEPRLQAK